MFESEAKTIDNAMDKLVEYLDKWYESNIANKHSEGVTHSKWDEDVQFDFLVFRNSLVG